MHNTSYTIPPRRLEHTLFLVLLVTTIASCAAVFAVTRGLFFSLTFADLHTRAAEVSTYTQHLITAPALSKLTAPQPANSALFKKYQHDLSVISSIAGLQSLYIAQANTDGTFHYLVGNNKKQGERFFAQGELLDEQLTPFLQECASGSPSSSNGLLQTDRASLFFACWPMQQTNKNTTEILALEFNCDALDNKNKEVTLFSTGISLALAGMFLLISRLGLTSISARFYRKMAYTDALSGLQNRTAFEQDLTIISDKLRPDSVVSVIVYDLDNLKEVNDNLGHVVGDNYIKTMATAISQLPFTDFVRHYRIGGDEFTSVVMNTAPATINAVLKQFEQTSDHISMQRYPVKFSYGHAAYDPHNDACLRDAFIKADKAMYQQKAAHKNAAQN